MEVNKIIVGPGCNLSHQELSNFNFEGLDLRGADFHGANLTNAKFDNAILHGCNFLETNLNGASFRNCEFYAAESVYTNEDFETERDQLVSDWSLYAGREFMEDQINNIFEEPELRPWEASARDFYEGVFSDNSGLFWWPTSTHYNDQEEDYNAPRWADLQMLFNMYTCLPHVGDDLTWDVFNSKEFDTLWESWMRSIRMHNSSACFDLCEFNDATVWPNRNHLDDYPIWNTPPTLIWSRCGHSHTYEGYGWSPTAPEECRICRR